MALIIEEQKLGETINRKTLVNYYNEVCRDSNAEIPLRKKIREALAQYIGYSNYEDFARDHASNDQAVEDKGKGNEKTGRRKLRIVISISISLLLIFAVFAIYKLEFGGAEVTRMMVWKGDRYEEVTLDLREYSVQELKFFKEDLIADFRKIEPDCNTEFFDARGEALLWYGKNGKGELEFFTALAKHPETGKSLKEITPYMIRKYICETY